MVSCEDTGLYTQRSLWSTHRILRQVGDVVDGPLPQAGVLPFDRVFGGRDVQG